MFSIWNHPLHSTWGSFVLHKVSRLSVVNELPVLYVQQSSAIAKHCKNMHGTMPQGLLKRFKVLKKCRNKFDFQAKSQRAIRLNSCESIFIIFAPSYVNFSRQNRFKCCNVHDLIHIFLDNGVMTALFFYYFLWATFLWAKINRRHL